MKSQGIGVVGVCGSKSLSKHSATKRVSAIAPILCAFDDGMVKSWVSYRVASVV